MTETHEEDYCPTVEGVIKKGQAVITCPHCGRTHYHSPEEGHRASHCGDARGKGGYIIVLPNSSMN